MTTTLETKQAEEIERLQLIVDSFKASSQYKPRPNITHGLDNHRYVLELIQDAAQTLMVRFENIQTEQGASDYELVQAFKSIGPFMTGYFRSVANVVAKVSTEIEDYAEETIE